MLIIIKVFVAVQIQLDTRHNNLSMGCELGKLASGSKGDDALGPRDPPPPTAPDPRLPLTARQKYSMVASWKGISRAMEPIGVHMFIK